jgi:DNA polymerase I
MNYLHSNYLEVKNLKYSGLRSEFKQGNDQQLEAFINDSKCLALDCETTGLDAHSNKISLVQLSDTTDTHVVAYDELKTLINLLNQKERKYIIHNAKFDLRFLFQAGLHYDKVVVYDTFLLECIIRNSATKVEAKLSTLLFKYFNIELSKEDQTAWIDLDYRNLNGRLLEYAVKDVAYLHKLLKAQAELITQFDLVESVKLEMQFVKALALIENNGVLLDKEIWKANLANNVEVQQGYAAELEAICVASFNVNSTKQLKEKLRELGYTLPTNKDGKETTAKDKLRELQPTTADNGFLASVLGLKEVGKMINSFGETYFNNINSKTGRIHSSFRQMLATGRMSSSKPNMQNLPRLKEVRQAFTASKGYKLITADYSSQEVLVLADLAGEQTIIDYYANNVDIHSKNATVIYKDLTGETVEINKENNPAWKDNISYRDLAKKVTFKLNYGGSAYTLKQDLACDEATANAIVNALNSAYEKQTAWQYEKMKEAVNVGYIQFNDVTKGKYFWKELSQVKAELAQLGYMILTPANTKPLIMFNRDLNPSRYDPDRVRELRMQFGKYLRSCQNYPIQATGANIVKQAIILITNYFVANSLDARIVNTVHDEIVVEAAETIATEVAEVVEKLMIEAGNMFIKSCAIKVETSIADHWQK